MKTKDFKKLSNEKTPEQIIGMHINWKIFLTNRQLDILIEKKNNRGRRTCQK